MKKRLLSSLLALCLLVGMMPTAAFAAEDSTDSVCEATEGCTLKAGHEGDCVMPDNEQPDTTLPEVQETRIKASDSTNWSEEADTDWYNDDADADADSFEIGTAAELAGLAKLVNSGETFKGKTVELIGEIDLNGKAWTPIGTTDNAFQGNFDGGEYSITGMTIHSDSDRVGLFGVTKDGTLENIKLEDVSIVSTRSGDAYVGAVTGEGYTGSIQNCSVTGLELSAKGNFIGGISGQGYAKISNCTVEDAEIESTGWKVGGIVGQLNEGKFTFSGNTVRDSKISSTGVSGAVGGIVGFCNYGDKSFTGCVVENTVIKAKTAAGGMIGSTMSNKETAQTFKFEDCEISDLTFESVNDGKITKSGGFIGAKYFRGLKNATIELNGCIAQDIMVDAAEDSTVGVLFGDAVATCTYNVIDSTVMVTENAENAASALVAIPAEGSTITIGDSEDESGSKTQIAPRYVSEANQYVDTDKLLDPKTGMLVPLTPENAVVTVTVNENVSSYKTLEAAIAAANAAEGDSNVTVTIEKSGEYAPFAITQNNITVQAAEGVDVVIKTDADSKMSVNAPSVTIKGLKFNSVDGSAVINGGKCDALTLAGCTFAGNGEEGSIALYIHQPNITITDCIFTDFERGYYTCGDNHAAGKIIVTDNTFENVRVPFDGYWGKPATDATDLQITGNKIDAGDWDTAYIQLWDYAQFQYWQDGADSKLNPEGKTALKGMVSGNAATGGELVLYATHCDWFAKSEITWADQQPVYRNLIVLDGLAEEDKVVVTNKDGSPITAFNDSTTAVKKGGKYVIYSLSEGEYTVSITQKPEGGDSIVTKQDLTVTDPKLGETPEIEVPALTEENKYVAQVGDNKYISLKEAVKAASDGQTVKILRSVTVDEPIVVDQNITVDGQKQFTITGKIELKNGTLKDLTLTTATPEKGLLTIGNSKKTAIRMEGVTVLYPVYGTSSGTTVVVSGNNADIAITGCLFTNHAENGDTIVGASQWSYGLYVNVQGADGSFTFENSRFDGAFRTMLPNINGTVSITGSTFTNSIYSNNSGSTSGSGEEATCITTANAEKNNFVVENNIFDNAGAFFFQKTENASVAGNTFKFDKFEHYIQVRGSAAHPLDLTQNTFVTGENSLVIVDTTAAPVLLPVGQKAVGYYAWAETDDSIRPDDYSSYVYAYNEDGSKTFYPESDVALDAFLHPKAGNHGVVSGDTVVITKELHLLQDAALPEGAVLVIEETGKLKIPAGTALTNRGTIVNPERIEGTVISDGTGVVKQIVTFYLTPDDADLLVKDQQGAVLIPDGDHVYYLADGTYSYEVSARGYYDERETFTVSGTAQTISVDLTPRSGGGAHHPDASDNSGAKRYDVSKPSDVENGSIKVSDSKAEKGETITITVTPDEGYELDELTVTDEDGDEIDLKDKGDGKFTFEMPKSDVEIEVSFKLIGADSENPFTDVSKNDYFYDAVLWAVDEGITSGMTDTSFVPNVSCTRAQMVTFLWRANGSPVVNDTMNFTDVPADAYYADAVRWAVSKGITSGISETSFAPDMTVTRAQTVTFLHRAAGAPAVSGGSFADVDANAYYANAVAWAVSENITSGTSASTFSPDAPCTRAQIVTFLYRDAQ